MLDAFFELEAEVLDLKQVLAKIDKQRVVDHTQYPEPGMKPITDRLAAVHSLGEVLHFLSNTRRRTLWCIHIWRFQN